MARLDVIIPNKILFDPARVTRVVENTMDGIAEDMLTDFSVTTQTWKSRPTFYIRKTRGQRVVFTTNKIYRFLARGTRVRYAHMTKNFRAKTVVGAIRSRVGKGGLAFISKLHPRPGIVARDWEIVIAKKWRKEFPKILQRAIDVEVQRGG